MQNFIPIVLSMILTQQSYGLPLEISKVWERGLRKTQEAGLPQKQQLGLLYALSEEASRHNFDIQDQLVILAMIEVESGFNNKAVSRAGAKGLMQLMPKAVKDAKSYCKITGKVDLFNPRTNIKLGVCYLAWIQERTGKDWVKMLIAYNGGVLYVRRYIDHKPIPGETANYVLRVLYLAKSDS